MLEIKELTKSFGNIHVLNKLTLHVEQGELFGFVGKNGVGKTTTMKIIAGLLKPDKGEVFINGINTTKDSERRKQFIGYMPDYFGVYDNLIVKEYMEFYTSIYHFTGVEQRKRIDELLYLVNLHDKSDLSVDSLSRGMKQRLGLARTLIHNPKLLILDEPSAGLELREQLAMRHILRNLKNNGVTTLVSSHNLNEIESLCSSIGIIDGGTMVFQGTLDEVNEKQATSNLLKMNVVGGIEVAIEVLKKNPFVSNITRQDVMISANFKGEINEQVALLTELINRNVKIASFYREEGNLESIFLQLTN